MSAFRLLFGRSYGSSISFRDLLTFSISILWQSNKYITCTGENVSHERTVHQLEYSALRFHDSYVLWYLNIFRLLFFGLGPFALLVYFNYHIHQVSITLHELKIVCTIDMQHPSC